MSENPSVPFCSAETFEKRCDICGKMATLEIGWTGLRCLSCKNIYFDMSSEHLVRLRREALGLSQQQIAEKLGYKTGSIKHFESSFCSRRYFDAISELIKTEHTQVSGGENNNDAKIL